MNTNDPSGSTIVSGLKAGHFCGQASMINIWYTWMPESQKMMVEVQVSGYECTNFCPFELDGQGHGYCRDT